MVRVDHVTHGSQYDRSKASGILRSLCSLLFCYYSLLVFVKITRFGYRHYYKSFFTVYVLTSSFPVLFRLSGYVVLGNCDTGDQTIPQNKIWGCFYFHFSVFAVGYYDIFQSPHLILSAFFNVRLTRGKSDEGLARNVVAFPVFCGDKLTVMIKPSFVFHASMTRVCIAFVMASKSVVFHCYSTKL